LPSSAHPLFCRFFSWARLRANSCARQLRVFCFLGSSRKSSGPSQNAAARFGSGRPRFWGASGKWGKKKEKDIYLNSVTIVGFAGADPEQREATGNGTKFTVLSVATQRSWKNAEDEWVSKTEWHRVTIIWN
jgi:hypothetical protein